MISKITDKLTQLFKIEPTQILNKYVRMQVGLSNQLPAVTGLPAGPIGILYHLYFFV